MHPAIYKKFEEICAENNAGGSVLEIGAIPSELTLLCLKTLNNTTEKIGINLKGPYTYKDFTIIQGNANAMNCFADNTFDTVLCNAMLEHDKFFWKTISEIKRVTKPGGLIIIGTPGYREYRLEKIRNSLRKNSFFRSFLQKLDFINNATITFRVHAQPGDYYRFSPQTYREVFFEGLTDVKITSVMHPPRIIGYGRKPIS